VFFALSTIQQVLTVEWELASEAGDFVMDLAKLLIQCFSLRVVQVAITGLYGQFASSVYEVSDYGKPAFSGKDKIVA
jgi:hypothetical protein